MTQHEVIKLHEYLAANFALGSDSLHGPGHWAKVAEVGLELAEEEGADALVVTLFGLLHDSQRQSEHGDPQHGERAAKKALELNGIFYQLTTEQALKLHYACTYHEKGRISEDPTIGCCWDADRLQLPRVGIVPDPKLMSTQAGKARAPQLDEGERQRKQWLINGILAITKNIDEVRRWLNDGREPLMPSMEPFVRWYATRSDSDSMRDIEQTWRKLQEINDDTFLALPFERHCQAILQLEEGRAEAIHALLSYNQAVTKNYNPEALLGLLEAVPELKETAKNLPERLTVFRGLCAHTPEEARARALRPFWAIDKPTALLAAKTWLHAATIKGENTQQNMYLASAEVKREHILIARGTRLYVLEKRQMKYEAELIVRPSNLMNVEVKELDDAEYKRLKVEEVLESSKRAQKRAKAVIEQLKAEKERTA